MLETTMPHSGAASKPYDIRRMFRAVANRCPGSLAIRSGGFRMTYGELDLASDRVCVDLRERGAGPGERVAILCERTADVICGMLGALKAGALFVPLDPQTPARRLQALLDVAAPVAVVKEPPGLDGTAPEGPVEMAEMGPEDPCYLYFTSGSTGLPKAITGRFKSIAHFIGWEIETLGVEEGWRVSQLIHPAFDAFLRDVFVPLCAGGTVSASPDRETLVDARRLLAWLDEEDIHLVHCVPSLFRTLLHVDPRPLPSLRYVLMSGEPLQPADVKRWQERYGMSTRLVNLYGPSETTMTKLFYFVQPGDGDRRTLPIGKPMPGARALVLDPQGRICPPRTVGEIYIRTPYRSLGYHGRPDLTAEVFVRNPFTRDPDDLIYKTGDLGRVLADGNLEFLGRKDSQVKIRGVRIELAEVENLLLSHPRVRETAVVDLDGAGGTKFLCAYVVLDGQGGPAGLRDFLAELLPEHSLPSAFVVLDELPRLPSGKTDRRSLPPPERARTATGSALDLPRTHAEEVVAAFFAQALGLGQIGIHESFFELGGHSLLATQILTRVRSTFDVEVPLRALFSHPTAAGLAREVEGAQRGGGRPAIASFREDRSAPSPLSCAQERFWAGREVEARTVASTIPMMLFFQGPLDLDCLRRSLQEIVDRHEVLRTSFREGAGGPVQVVHPAIPVRLPVADLAELSPEEQREEIRRHGLLDGRAQFDYERGPLFRMTVFRCTETDHVVLFTIHHVAFDGWSSSVLARELSVLYQAFREGRPSPLPPLAFQYQDFARWQRQTLAGETLVRQVAFWREQLRGAVPVDLALGRARPRQPTFRAGVEAFAVPKELEVRLDALSGELSVTLFMILLAGFKVLLLHETGQEDIVVTCLFANRNQVEIENLIGNFYAGLPLRTQLAGTGTFRHLLDRVRDVTLAAHENPDILYEPVMQGMDFLGPGDRGGLATFRILFQLAKLPPPEQTVSNLKVLRVPFDTGKIRQDLSLFLSQSDRLAGRFKYNLDVLDQERVLSLRDRYLQILAAAVDDPDRPLSLLLPESAAPPQPILFAQETDQ